MVVCLHLRLASDELVVEKRNLDLVREALVELFIPHELGNSSDSDFVDPLFGDQLSIHLALVELATRGLFVKLSRFHFAYP